MDEDALWDTGGGIRGATGTAAAFLWCAISSSVERHEGTPIGLGDDVKLVVALGFNVVPGPRRGEGRGGRRLSSGRCEPTARKRHAPHAHSFCSTGGSSPTLTHPAGSRELHAPPPCRSLVPLETERWRQHPQARLPGMAGAEQTSHGGGKRTGPAGAGCGGSCCCGDGGGATACRRLHCCSNGGHG